MYVDVTGLRTARGYFYRFVAGGEASPVGRTRTVPAAGAAVDRLQVCFGSCSNYEAGHYAAYRHMVAEDPDLILFLGAYIYEGALNAKDPVRLHRNPEPFDLAGYRVRYATYKLDPLLQAAHHAAPWSTKWDDHEVANDYGAARDEDNTDPAIFLRRRTAAYQAYFEHIPLGAATRPWSSEMRIYHTLDWGKLAQFQIIDDQQYRVPPACQPPELDAEHRKYRSLIEPCPTLGDPHRTRLGARQERWLMERLGDSLAQWNMLTQQTLMHQQARLDPAHPSAASNTAPIRGPASEARPHLLPLGRGEDAQPDLAGRRHPCIRRGRYTKAGAARPSGDRWRSDVPRPRGSRLLNTTVSHIALSAGRRAARPTSLVPPQRIETRFARVQPRNLKRYMDSPIIGCGNPCRGRQSCRKPEKWKCRDAASSQAGPPPLGWWPCRSTQRLWHVRRSKRRR